MLETLWRDARYSVRAMASRVPTTAAMLLTIGLGIGATTAIFSVVNAVLIKPLPYPQPDELVSVWLSTSGSGGGFEMGLSASLYVTYRDQGSAFEQLGVWIAGAANATGNGDPEEIPTLAVSREVLPTLGVLPVLGRGFSAVDDSAGGTATVILTHSYWQRRFGGDPGVIGRTVTIDAQPREVIGVLPPDFSFPNLTPAVLLPLRFDPKALPGHTNFSFRGIARLKAGVTIEAANADADRLLPIWVEAYGIDRQMFESVHPVSNLHRLKSDVIGDVGNVLWVLMGMVGVVLLIACANVANLMLVRAVGRRQELAVRTALGASPLRIARALLVESLLLGLAGGVLGLGLAAGGLRALAAFAPPNLPRLAEISLDPAVLLFAVAASLLSGVLFGLIPVLTHGRVRALPLGAARGSSHGRERRLSQDALVVAQVALALVILVGSGLMLRTFQQMLRVDPGFVDAKHLQMARIAIPAGQVAVPDVVRMQNDMLDRIAAIPGVESAAFASALPLEPGMSTTALWVEGQTAPGELPPQRRWKYASPGMLATQGTVLVAGRDFAWTDVYEAREVVIVSESTARETWGSVAEALGGEVRFGPEGPWEEVIGVAADVHEEGIDRPAPSTLYRRAGVHPGANGTQITPRAATFAIRTDRAGSESLLAEIRAAVSAVNPNVPLAQVRTLDEVYRQSMARTSFTLTTLLIAGVMALAIGLVGIYGVVAYTVAARTREIGIRVAVGAQNRHVTRMFLRHALALTCVGLVVGLGVAAASATLMESLLFGVATLDWVAYGAAVLLLAVACMLASYLPTRRALAVDPVQALRAE